MNITSRRLEILDKMLEEYSYKYGYYSVAGLLIKYYILITSLDLFVNCEDKYKYDLYVNLKEATDLVLDHYQKAERSPTISQNTWSYEVEINGEKFYKFDSEIYEKYYSNSGEIIQKKLVKASKEIINSIEGHKFYLYAVNKNMEPIIYLKTIPLFDLMNGRQRLKEGEYPIAHPVLLHNYDLIAKGAGEIVFIKDDDKNIIKGALINNKSGHFRPSPSTLEVVKKIFSQALNISKENIVTIGIEGV